MVFVDPVQGGGMEFLDQFARINFPAFDARGQIARNQLLAIRVEGDAINIERMAFKCL